MIVSIASGKGGTGKTMIATSLALSLGDSRSVQFLDCDVEEPNAHLFLKPAIIRRDPVGVPVPVVDSTKCTYCGLCAEACAFHALAVFGQTKKVLVFPELCHGCGACSYLCPERALSEDVRESGEVELGRAGNLEFVHGRLHPGEAMAPPVIRRVKAHIGAAEAVILDAPPGTACPVVETVKGSDYCLLVTEPTPFGLSDLMLAVGMVRKLGIPCGVVVNRAGVEDTKTEAYCRQEGIPILLSIPLDTAIAQAYARGEPLVKAFPQWRDELRRLYGQMEEQCRATTRVN